MKSRTKSQRIPDGRWKGYVTASAAGALIGLGTHCSADADITIVEVNRLLLDQRIGDGYADLFGLYDFGKTGASFYFRQYYGGTGFPAAYIAIFGVGNISIAGSVAAGGPSYDLFYPYNLPYGQNVSTAGVFDVVGGERGDMAWRTPFYSGGYPNSNFLLPGRGFIGFRFDVGSGTQYGFIEIDMFGPPEHSATFVRYAWADPGESISTWSIPEPCALGILALGSLGLLAWRRNRKA